MKTSLLLVFTKFLNKIKINKIIFFTLITSIFFLLFGIIAEINYYKDRIYPNIFIDNIDVSGLTITEANKKLSTFPIKPHTLKLVVDNIQVASSSAKLGAFKNYNDVVNFAYKNTRNEEKYKNALSFIKSFISINHFSTKIQYDEKKLNKLLDILLSKVEIKGKTPSVSLEISGNENSIIVFKGSPGRTIDRDQTKENIKFEVANNNFTINAKVASTSTVLSDEQITAELIRAKKFVNKKLILTADGKKFNLNDKEIISLLEPPKKYNNANIEKIILKWSKEIDRDPQNAEFDYNKDNFEVKTFKPNKNGLKVNQDDTKKTLISWLQLQEKTTSNNYSNLKNSSKKNTTNKTKENNDQILKIPLKTTTPDTTLKETNDIGINERLGFGESYFYHSIINRVHNVGITADRISLTIIPPEKEFSFNKTLGEVSSKTGYKSAYVISKGKTILGDGGGVCQVSSTLFRAVLDAGLKVTKRLQHSYRVSYYELNSQPGFDATVYAGNVDFRFINDTSSYILIYASTDLDNRYMNVEIYGTSDGRTTEISNYKKWDFRKPPAPQYYPTSDLPKGVTKKIDWAVSGIKAEFTHIIKDKNGNITNKKIYYSNYRPWSAKYMVGI